MAFGSGSSQSYSLPIFNNIGSHTPDLFIFLRDNIYGETNDMTKLKAKYQRLISKESYMNFKKNASIIVTYDDYGKNDAGKNDPFKEQYNEIVLDTFDEPINSERKILSHTKPLHKEYAGLQKVLKLVI
jgi:alkaline phosphatase D